MVVSSERKKGDRLRKKILKRDDYQCVLCKSTEDLEVHHMKALYYKGKSTEENLITLCSECHRYAPEESIEENQRYLQERNKNIYERMMNEPDISSMVMISYVEFLKARVDEYVSLGFIDEHQKNFILTYELNKVM